MNTKVKWFDLPSHDEIIDFWDIARKVYVERFSQELFDTFAEKYFELDESERSETDENDIDSRELQKQKLDDVVEQFSKLEVPDDWEDLASDEE